MTLCEENCKLIECNYTNKKAKCSCDIKLNLQNVDKIIIDKDLLKKSLIDINIIFYIIFPSPYTNKFN